MTQETTCADSHESQFPFFFSILVEHQWKIKLFISHRLSRQGQQITTECTEGNFLHLLSFFPFTFHHFIPCLHIALAFLCGARSLWDVSLIFLSACLFSLFISQCASGGGEGKSGILKKWMSEGKQWTRRHLTCRHTRVHTQTIKALDRKGPHEAASGLNRLALPCLWEHEQRYKCWGVVIEAMWYPGIICQFAADRTGAREDRIMSGEHPQCIWRSHWKVPGSDYTPIREQRRVKTCQFPALTWV